MADLDVQPKKKTSWLPWLIALIAILLLFLLLRSCNRTHTVASMGDSTTNIGPDTSANAGAVATTVPVNGAADWNNIDRSAPTASYSEITNKDISVNGNDNYSIYSLGENVLFETGNSTIRKNAADNLKQVAASISQRYKGGDIRIFGYTDSVGSKGYNKELAQQRAEAVRNWLAANGGIDSSKISINAIGEGQPVATNNTAQGRQQNRRVEVAVRKAQ